jgi:hypothetical protein
MLQAVATTAAVRRCYVQMMRMDANQLRVIHCSCLVEGLRQMQRQHASSGWPVPSAAVARALTASTVDAVTYKMLCRQPHFKCW